MVRTCLLLAAVAALPLIGSAADATVVRKKGPESGPHAGGIDVGVPQGRVRIQCWQDGEKIIDETDLNVLSLSVASQLNSLRFRRAEEPGNSLAIVTRNRTACLLSPKG